MRTHITIDTKTTDGKQNKTYAEIITPTRMNDDTATAPALALYAAKNQPQSVLMKV